MDAVDCLLVVGALVVLAAGVHLNDVLFRVVRLGDDREASDNLRQMPSFVLPTLDGHRVVSDKDLLGAPVSVVIVDAHRSSSVDCQARLGLSTRILGERNRGSVVLIIRVVGNRIAFHPIEDLVTSVSMILVDVDGRISKRFRATRLPLALEFDAAGEVVRSGQMITSTYGAGRAVPKEVTNVY